LATRFGRTSSGSDLATSLFPLDARGPLQSYCDLIVTARVADKDTFRVGANNLFGKEPPLLSATAAPIDRLGNGNTYPTDMRRWAATSSPAWRSTCKRPPSADRPRAVTAMRPPFVVGACGAGSRAT
jgi:hypothetical protein